MALLVAGLAVAACLLLGTAHANNGALIKSKSGQPLTSSTLHWVAVSAGRMPDDAVEGGQGTYVCRFQHAGRLVIGATDEEESSSCRIVYFGRIIIKDKFEVLVNVHQAGRLLWTRWDRSLTSFVGAVQVGDQYVGRVKTTDGSQYRSGHLDPTVQRGRIFSIDNVEDQVVESIEGELLVELEAIAYDLGALQVSRNRRKIQSMEDVRLAHTILDNMEDGPQEQTVASTLSYVITHSVYLSHVRGMIKGLPGSVHLGGESSGGAIHFRWGDSSISGTFPQLTDVSHRLEKGTAVNVSLTARRITFDAPFSAKLSTTYSDQFVGRRQIDGQSRQTVLEDIKLQYGDVYFVSNGSLVPSTTSSTSTTTTTTPTTPTTTTTMSTTTEPQPGSSVTSPPSLKQTKETLELKSRNVSSRSGGSTSSSVANTAVFVFIPLLLLFIGR